MYEFLFIVQYGMVAEVHFRFRPRNRDIRKKRKASRRYTSENVNVLKFWYNAAGDVTMATYKTSDVYGRNLVEAIFGLGAVFTVYGPWITAPVTSGVLEHISCVLFLID